MARRAWPAAAPGARALAGHPATPGRALAASADLILCLSENTYPRDGDHPVRPHAGAIHVRGCWDSAASLARGGAWCPGSGRTHPATPGRALAASECLILRSYATTYPRKAAIPGARIFGPHPTVRQPWIPLPAPESMSAHHRHVMPARRHPSACSVAVVAMTRALIEHYSAILRHVYSLR